MAYQGRILARSPYYITANAATAPIISAKLLVYIWAGDSSSKPANPTYTIDKNALTGSDDAIVFEISTLVRDYFFHTQDIDATNRIDTVWVETTLIVVDSGGLQTGVDDSYIGQDGWGAYEDGSNPQPTGFTKSLEFEKFEIVPSLLASTLSIPVMAGQLGSFVELYKDGVLESSTPIATGTDSADYIQYFTQVTTTFPETAIIKSGATPTHSYSLTYREGCNPSSVDGLYSTTVGFINKQGALEVFTMYGREQETISASREDYKADIGTVTGGVFGYDVSTHQETTFNVNGRRRLTLTTDWMLEARNQNVEELLMSEYVWLFEKPVKILTSSVQKKRNKYDKIINYTIEFEEANNLINDVY